MYWKLRTSTKEEIEEIKEELRDIERKISALYSFLNLDEWDLVPKEKEINDNQ